MALTLQFLSSLTQVKAEEWDRLFAADYPFTRHGFLLALEQGGSVDHNTGWQSRHLTVWQDEQLIAAVPGYLKTHSYGEYLFDWQIGQAYQQFQLPFYPKWIAAIPFTPVTGPRLGILTPELTTEIVPLISQFLQQQLTADGIAKWQSIQWLYTEESLTTELTAQQFWPRHDVQFLWHNRGYRQFADFLASLTSRKRKQISKERAGCQHLLLKTLTGTELNALHWQQLMQCYQATYFKRSGHAGYISEASFRLLARQMAKHIVVFAAFDPKQPDHFLAASLCFIGSDTLYGRYWGAIAENDLLHFELCYYQGIAYCIQHGLKYFDAGAQGEHKLKRGFEPVRRYGAYAFASTALSAAIKNYFVEESAQLTSYIAGAKDALPYKII